MAWCRSLRRSACSHPASILYFTNASRHYVHRDGRRVAILNLRGFLVPFPSSPGSYLSPSSPQALRVFLQGLSLGSGVPRSTPR